MSPKVADSRLVQSKAGGLCHIMQQRRPPQGQIRRNSLDHLGRMGINVKGVMGIVLLKAPRRPKCQERLLGSPEQNLKIRRPGSREEAAKLREDPLPGLARQGGGKGRHSGQSLFLRSQAVPGCKTNASKDPQAILLKPPDRFSHSPKNPGPEIGLPAQRDRPNPLRGL